MKKFQQMVWSWKNSIPAGQVFNKIWTHSPVSPLAAEPVELAVSPEPFTELCTLGVFPLSANKTDKGAQGHGQQRRKHFKDASFRNI